MTRDEADDIKRHFDVVAERLEGQIRQVAEGVVRNGERLDRVEGKVDKLETRVVRIEVRLDRVDERLDGVEKRFDGVEQRFERMETEIRAEFAEVKAMIKLSYAELDRRLSTLESVVSDLAHRVEVLEGRSS